MHKLEKAPICNRAVSRSTCLGCRSIAPCRRAVECHIYATCFRTLCRATYIIPFIPPGPELCETPLPDALALVSTIKPSTPTDTERREIAGLKDKAQNRVIHGKLVPPAVQAEHPVSKVPQLFTVVL